MRTGQNTGQSTGQGAGQNAGSSSESEPAWPVLDHRAQSLISDDVRREIRALHTIRPWRSLWSYLLVYAAIVGIFVVEAYAASPVVTVLAVVLIAGRQHSLYVLNHDASHHNLFRSRITNKVVGTLLSNLPMFHHPEAWSYIQWRRVHVLHHKYLFTEQDPNYVGRRMRGDTERHYTPALLLWTCIKNGLLTITQLFWGRQDYVAPKSRQAIKGHHNHLRALFLPFRDDPEMEQERRIKLVFFAAALVAVGYFQLWRPFLLLWILPMYTVYPMILTAMDLTEHRWTEDAGDLNLNTRSTRLGITTRLVIGSLPRTLHREHHVFPGVVASELPRLSTLLCEARISRPPAAGATAIVRELAAAAART